ncbi:MAG TPA: hypothetical protein VFV80_03585 [Geminicoccaceae bacterium]|nr:hypothetical protein [Geminicoccaceae bacterium]
MYAFLRRWLPEGPATMLVGLWYALLIVLVLWSLVEPQAEFRYVKL